jgi:hypothetical protein
MHTIFALMLIQVTVFTVIIILADAGSRMRYSLWGKAAEK